MFPFHVIVWHLKLRFHEQIKILPHICLDSVSILLNNVVIPYFLFNARSINVVCQLALSTYSFIRS